MSSEKKDDVRVEDRRHFDRDGNTIREEDESAGKASKGTKSGQAQAAEPAADKIDFVSLLFTYVHTALIYLGEAEDPVQKTTSENIEGARQMIDILELMQQKTRGNLSTEETQYLESALYDLRMRFMKKSKLIE